MRWNNFREIFDEFNIFPLQISVEDKLPKMVCCHCSKKLDSIHRFATMAVEMQDKLKILATTSCTVETHPSPKPEEEEPKQETVKETETEETKKENITVTVQPQLWNYPEKVCKLLCRKLCFDHLFRSVNVCVCFNGL